MSGPRRRSESSMMSELPPIFHNNRPSSGKSRKSSKDSSNGGLPRASVFKQYEKPTLISLDNSPVVGETSNRPGSRKNRSQLSPASTGSSQASAGVQSNINHVVADSQELSRTKSWCTTEVSGGTTPKLETLFEKNGVVQTHSEAKMTKTNMTVPVNSASSGGQVASQKPPAGRHASTGSSNFISTPRTNLAKLSTADSTAIYKKTPTNSHNNTGNTRAPRGLSRHRSEQNIHLSSLTPRTEKTKLMSAAPQHSSRPLHKTKSQPYLTHYSSSRSSEGMLNAQNLNKMQVPAQVQNECEDEDDDDDDEDRKGRIIEWLIGVESTAERPPTPEVFDEMPPQTDTAIHVVYKGT